MSKGINKLKYLKVKESLLKGKSYKQSAKDAGYSPNSAINAYRLNVVKCCEEEIKREFKASSVSVESVLSELELVRTLALETGDLSTAGRMAELKGRYLAMFTDKREVSGEIIHKEERDIIDKYIDSNRLVCNDRDKLSKDNVPGLVQKEIGEAGGGGEVGVPVSQPAP